MSAVPMYSTIGQHAQLTGLSATQTLDITAPANAVLVQAVTQNIRYKLNGTATSGQGFVLTAGNDPILIGIGSMSISVQEETASATLEYQLVKVHGLGV